MCDTHSEQINELAKALAAAQGELEPAEKNATAAIGEKGKLKRKYADLTAMIDAVRKVLPKHGLSIAQSLTELQGGKMALAIDGDLFKAILRFPTVV
jgi:predicted  nucleic acid-binding Zn-ribbon protein